MKITRNLTKLGVNGLARAAVLASVLVAQSGADLPTSVKLTPMFGTEGANKFRFPVWFGEVPGLPGVFAVVEQGNSAADRGRIFLLEKDGAGYSKKEFLAIDVLKGGEEPGLLGLAFHPKFADNRRYFIYYVAPGGSSVLEERMADATLRKDAGATPKQIITFTRLRTNHNGGQLGFGKDGYLYAGFGEDGQYDPAQSLKTFKGKMVRLDVDKPANGKNYGIPSDNPFAGSSDSETLKEIWAYGLRNPWRWSFDPANGDLWLADVGEKAREEIDVVKSGNNMGWPQTEGEGCSTFYPSCTISAYIPPVKTFKRDSSICIVGGYIFRGNTASEAYGHYVFADFQLKYLYVMTLSQGRSTGVQRIGIAPDYISSMGTDALGNLYAMGWYNGIIYQLDDPAFRGSGTPTKSVPRLPRKGPIIRKGSSGYIPNPAWLLEDRSAWLYNLGGKRVAALRAGQPLRNLDPGTYFTSTLDSGGERGILVHMP